METQYDRLLKQKEVAVWIGMSEAWLYSQVLFLFYVSLKINVELYWEARA